MDSLYRQLHVEGVGAEKHSIEPFRKETNISGEILLLHCYEQFSSTVEKKKTFISEAVKSTEISNFHN